MLDFYFKCTIKRHVSGLVRIFISTFKRRTGQYFSLFWFLLEFCLFLHTMKWQISFSMLWNEQYSSKITCSIKDCKNSIKLSSLSLLKTKLTDFFFFYIFFHDYWSILSWVNFWNVYFFPNYFSLFNVLFFFSKCFLIWIFLKNQLLSSLTLILVTLPFSIKFEIVI